MYINKENIFIYIYIYMYIQREREKMKMEIYEKIQKNIELYGKY